MKLRSAVLGVFLISGVAAFAQEVTTPKLETGFTYTYSRVNAGGSIGSYSANGGAGYAEWNLNRVVGLVADLGANRVGTANWLPINNTEFTYLFGPRFNWRTSKFTPYVQTLVGGARFSNAYDSNLQFPFLGGAQNSFAAALGGGIDYRINNHLAIKPVEVDYLMTQVPDTFSNVKGVQNNLRYSAGLVLQFGSK